MIRHTNGVRAARLVGCGTAAAITSLVVVALAVAPSFAAGNTPPATAQQLAPEVNPVAFWVETTICSVVLKTSIETGKPLLPGTPIDQLSSMAAICTSNISGQNLVPGGVRSLLGEGFRVTSISHQVAVLTPTAAGSKAEMLVSALFALERPQRTSSR